MTNKGQGIDTKFSQGKTVFQVEGDNIFSLDIISIDIEITVDNEGVETDIEYQCIRKEKVGLIKTEEHEVSFDEESTNVFSTRKEADEHLVKIEEAKKLIEDSRGENTITIGGGYTFRYPFC